MRNVVIDGIEGGFFKLLALLAIAPLHIRCKFQNILFVIYLHINYYTYNYLFLNINVFFKNRKIKRDLRSISFYVLQNKNKNDS